MDADRDVRPDAFDLGGPKDQAEEETAEAGSLIQVIFPSPGNSGGGLGPGFSSRAVHAGHPTSESPIIRSRCRTFASSFRNSLAWTISVPPSARSSKTFSRG